MDLPGGGGRGPALAGVLVLDKPQGLTSHDVVAEVRRLTGVRRVGHAGTLDPLATGVLLVCLGPATRLAEYLAEGRKSYRATIHLGLATDTWDAAGRVVEEHSWEHLSREAVEEALAHFRGAIWQVPPMYAALKRDGQPLYRLARQGVEVERAPRQVHIDDLQLLAWQPPRVTIELTCSKGTYVRSLAHELGQRLGVGGHLAELVRLAVGPFRLEQAVNLERFRALCATGGWRAALLPLEDAVRHLPRLEVDGDAARRLALGQIVALPPGEDDHPHAVYDGRGRFLGIVRYRPDQGGWQPEKVFVTPEKL